MKIGAFFSDDRRYRFFLYRIWKEERPKVMFIGLNPSTANEREDDPTIKRVIKFAFSWGYGGVYMCNLFPYVTAYPIRLRDHQDDYKAQNNLTLFEISKKCDAVVFAWGNFRQAKERAKEVEAMFPGACVLGINANGSPKHPLYILGETKLKKYESKKRFA